MSSFDLKYKKKYQKYKFKYLEIKQSGGRLLDLTREKFDEKKETVSKSIQEIEENIQKLDLAIKESTEQKSKLELSKKELDAQHAYLSKINYDEFNLKCNQFDPTSGIPTIEDANFDYCNDINNKLTSKENSYLIIFNFMTDSGNLAGHPDTYLNNYIKGIIQNSYSKSDNIILITTKPFSSTKKIQIIDTSDIDALQNLNKKIVEIISRSGSNNNLTIYNITHGAMRYYNTSSFISSASSGVIININDYFNKVIKPLYESNKKFNVMIVNGNCFSSYNIFKYVKKLSANFIRGENKINLYTYSTRPYIKYLIWLRNFLHFVSIDIKQKFDSASNDTDKFKIFEEAIEKVKFLLTTDKSLTPNEQLNKDILLYTLSTENKQEIIIEINKIKDVIDPSKKDNIFESVKKLINNKNKDDLQKDIMLNRIDLYKDSNSDSFLNSALEQGGYGSTDTYTYKKLLDIFNSTSFVDYNTLLTIQQLNDNKDKIIDWYFGNSSDSGVSTLEKYFSETETRKLLEMSFKEQTDILFVPIENNDLKRAAMRNVRLIDLL
jgi:hypothetical protein